MAFRVTVGIPETLHERLRRRAQDTGTSMRTLIVQAIEQAYAEPRKGKFVTGPLVRKIGKLGPRFPVDENPHDLVIS